MVRTNDLYGNRLHKIKEKLAINIKIARIKNDITQEKLGELAGISTKYLNQIENKKANPSIVVIVSICQALNISLDELLEK